ncbi:DUF2971 domain-containing protein [Bradyrhizobium sp. CCBAU 11430]|uniref:DUF2971 domain-containing protein n=1 Tax=Bradyrhizobium sp. CCBAU 11430 TaxID=1630881 RepID=UPI002304D8A5|nr:DUF2971 domain-containing protein [Bradyrhizobium sp. CCBAU 11430]
MASRFLRDQPLTIRRNRDTPQRVVGELMAIGGNRAKVRVYHFANREFGLDDIRRRRLKIATIADVNDPFELLPSSTDKLVRQRFRIWREQFDKAFGMLCFSRSWRNPVQWSHYAAKHTGLCFGFDIPSNLLTKVRYSADRLTPSVEVLEGGGPSAQKEMLKLLSTKYEHWRYENELRLFTRLNDKDPSNGLYFADFSSRMTLKEVIVGPLSAVTQEELKAALGDLEPRVDVYKARLAFRTYTVTRQLNPTLWE